MQIAYFGDNLYEMSNHAMQNSYGSGIKLWNGKQTFLVYRAHHENTHI